VDSVPTDVKRVAAAAVEAVLAQYRPKNLGAWGRGPPKAVFVASSGAPPLSRPASWSAAVANPNPTVVQPSLKSDYELALALQQAENPSMAVQSASAAPSAIDEPTDMAAEHVETHAEVEAVPAASPEVVPTAAAPTMEAPWTTPAQAAPEMPAKAEEVAAETAAAPSTAPVATEATPAHKSLSEVPFATLAARGHRLTTSTTRGAVARPSINNFAMLGRTGDDDNIASESSSSSASESNAVPPTTRPKHATYASKLTGGLKGSLKKGKQVALAATAAPKKKSTA